MFGFIPKDGTYQWDIIATTSWQIPLGMSFSKLKLDVQSNYNISTSFYDTNRSELFPELMNWPSPQNAYKTLLVQSNVVYSNIHQYGLSQYEKRGISVGATILGFWDINKTIRLMNEKESQNTSVENQTQFPFLQALASVESFTFGLSVDIAIPRLTPLTMHKGMVLSVPANVKLDVFKDIGTALKFGIEILPFGIEIDRGIQGVNVLFNNLGCRVGYYGAFVYDTNTTKLPNLLDIETFKNVFVNSTYVDYLLLSLDYDFTPVIGRLSETKVHTAFDVYYYITQDVFKFLLRIEFVY